MAEERSALEGGACRVQGRVEAEHPRPREQGGQDLPGGQEALLRAADRGHADAARQVDVVIVVPARHRVDHPVPGIAERAEDAVDHRPRSADDEHRLQRDLEPELALVEARHGVPQGQDAGGRRVVGLAVLQRLLDAGGQPRRDAEVPRVEVANRQVADRPPGRLEGTDLGGDAEDLRADEPVRHLRHPPPGVRSGVLQQLREVGRRLGFHGENYIPLHPIDLAVFPCGLRRRGPGNGAPPRAGPTSGTG